MNPDTKLWQNAEDLSRILYGKNHKTIQKELINIQANVLRCAAKIVHNYSKAIDDECKSFRKEELVSLLEGALMNSSLMLCMYNKLDL